MIPRDTEHLFWNWIIKTDTCWIWTGIKKGGRGFINPLQKSARRFSYELFNGPIPDNVNILCTCNNSLCVNPEHLQVIHTNTLKLCSKCKKYKDKSEFHKNSNRSDGLSAVCKNCQKEYQQNNHSKMITAAYRWREANPQKAREAIKKWEQTSPKYKKWIEKNRDKIRLANSNNKKKYPEKNVIREQRRRAKKRANGGTYTAEEWNSLCMKYDFCCLCCKEKKPLTVDHVIPLSKGGVNAIDNIQPLCLECNSRKGQKIIDYRV